ncbi:MAG: serine hydroxymethyltransferase [Pseudolabrys sp.]
MSDQREIYFEFTVVGALVKVAAIDSATATEVVVMGPATASRADLERLAAQKLRARLTRDAGETR